jgi:hypothetical protein
MGALQATDGNSIMAGVSTVTRAKLADISTGPNTTTTSKIYIFNDGTASFGSGDLMYVSVRAEGRWF